MVIAVTLNAAVDKTLVVPGFKLNSRHYAEQTVSVPGGKGINVARVLHELGVDVTVLGFSAGHGGRFIEDGLAQEGIACELVRIPGESRMCLTLLNDDSHSEVNELGPAVPADAVDAFMEVYRRHLQNASAIVLSGSIPPSIPPTIYRTLLALAGDRLTLLDAKGDALRYGLEACPTVVKPNREELSELVGRDIRSIQDALETLPQIRARQVLISLGEAGAILSTPDLTLHGSLRNGHVVSPVGSGDSLLAAYLWGYQRGESPEACLRLGVAAGLANTWYLGAGMARRADVERLSPLVQVAPCLRGTVSNPRTL